MEALLVFCGIYCLVSVLVAALLWLLMRSTAQRIDGFGEPIQTEEDEK